MAIKRLHHSVAIFGAVAGVFFLAVPDLIAEPLKAFLTEKGSQLERTVFVLESDNKGVKISATASGANARVIPHSKIVSIFFEEPSGWSQAMAVFEKGDHVQSAKLFKDFAKKYKKTASYKDSYGALARFFQIDSLRRSGDIKAMVYAVEGLDRKPVTLNESYQGQLELFRCWEQAGKERWERLQEILTGYEVAKKNGAPGQAGFKNMPPAELVQVAYLRGLASEKNGDTSAALNDYYRAFVLGRGAEASVAKKAITASLGILKNSPSIATDQKLRKEAYMLTVVYTGQFGGELPAEFKEFAKDPAS